MDIGTHLRVQEVIRCVFSNNEVNTQEIERVKIGWNKICIREDLAKVKIVFSKESSCAIFFESMSIMSTFLRARLSASAEN